MHGRDEVGVPIEQVNQGQAPTPNEPLRNVSSTPTLDPGLIAALRGDLQGAGWTVDAVDALLTHCARGALARDQLTPARVELEGDNAPVAVLTRLFILSEPLTETAVAAALPALGVDGAVQLGLVHLNEGTRTVRATVDLRPHSAKLPALEDTLAPAPGSAEETGGQRTHHWWVASDLGQAQTGQPPREDYVLGIASASTNLLRATLRQPVDAALDLGCGCGILALYLATHAQRVVATDISARACQFTRFNAALNQVSIDVRQGSLFDPVQGETFDLITSNPPFVITPEAVRRRANLEYRDGGMERDSLIPLIVEQGLSHLRSGGTLQMLANWEVEDEGTWQARPSAWVRHASTPLLSSGDDVIAWVVQRDLVDVSQYAEWWMRDARGDQINRTDWENEYRDWMRDFHAAGTAAVGLGSIAIRVTSPGRAQQNHAGSAVVQDKPGAPGRVRRAGQARQPGAAAAALAAGQSAQRPGALVLVCEYLPDGPPVDGEAVRTALQNLSLPANWDQQAYLRTSDVREVRYFVPGTTDPEIVRITQGRPGGRERTVPSSVAALVGVCDGELTPAQVIPAVAMLLDAEEDSVRAEIEAALPELLRSGVLVLQ